MRRILPFLSNTMSQTETKSNALEPIPRFMMTTTLCSVCVHTAKFETFLSIALQSFHNFCNSYLRTYFLNHYNTSPLSLSFILLIPYLHYSIYTYLFSHLWSLASTNSGGSTSNPRATTSRLSKPSSFGTSSHRDCRACRTVSRTFWSCEHTFGGCLRASRDVHANNPVPYGATYVIRTNFLSLLFMSICIKTRYSVYFFSYELYILAFI